MMTLLNPIVRTAGPTRVYQSGDRQIQALRGIDLEIPAGHMVAIRGRSGSGKTTLLNCMGGLDQPSSGEVFVGGQPLSELSEAELTLLRRTRLSFVFQSFALLPTFSAYENVELPLRIQGLDHAERNRRTVAALDAVELGRWAKHRPYEMSGGQQQRVAIARALATRPKLILADEPTGELDTETSHQILGLLQHLVEQERITLAVATHDPLVLEYASLCYELQDGQIKPIQAHRAD